MARCNHCQVNIADDALVCPLCHGGLSKDKMTEGSTFVGYPDVSKKFQKRRFFVKLFVFFSIVAELIMLLINYLTYKNTLWSLLPGIGLAYVCFTLIFSLRDKKSIRQRLVVQLGVGILGMIALDNIIGYQGWSIDIGVPSAIFGVEVSIILLILTHMYSWQSYLLTQIVLLLTSIGFLIPAMIRGGYRVAIIGPVTLFVGIVLAGMLVFGWQDARRELEQRFRF